MLLIASFHGRIFRPLKFLKGLHSVNWFCMCRSNGELVDHLLLHSDVAHALWGDVFQIFGIHWVMPGSVVNLCFFLEELVWEA